MSTEFSQPNPAPKDQLSMLIDGLSCVGALGGTIASVVTQQVMFATVPLSLMFSMQVMNRLKQQQSQLSHHQTTAEQMKIIEHDTSNLSVNSFFLERQIKELHGLLESHGSQLKQLQHDASHSQVNSYYLENRMVANDQAQAEKTLALQKALKLKLQEVDGVIENLRGIIAEGKPGSDNMPAEGYFKRGMNQEELGNLNAALADYSRVLEKETSHSHAYLRRGLVYIALGRKQDALLDLNAAAKYFFAEGDLNQYEIAKEKVAKIHSQEQDAAKLDQLYKQKNESVGVNVNSLFG